MSWAFNRVLRAWALLLFAATAHGQVANRVIEDIDISVHAGYTDISILYACGLRYLNHLPSSEGETVRIRTVPQADCMLSGDGLTPPVVPTIARSLITGLDLDRPVSNEVDIAIRWRKSERFLVMPTGDGRGLRIRVLRPTEAGGRVMVGADIPGRTASYAINLESSREPFTPEAIATAAKITTLRVYVSDVKVEDEQWYRLRAGPFVTEADAKLSLLSVREQYPKAWLAIGDDDTLTSTTPDPVTTATTRDAVANATLTPAEIATVLKQAKTAFRKKDYATAIPLLTKLLAQPEFPERAEAQELIGLARERSRQIAHAKAEYEEYLRRYPNGPAADRVQQRLHALAMAARKEVRGLSGAGESESPWRIYGGFSQLYRRDDSELENSVVTSNATTQNTLLNDFALVARRRGERFDFTSRVSAGYGLNFLDNDVGDKTRVSTAFVELSDRQWGWRSRLGRQSVTGTGVFGTFDGAYADYQWRPRWRFSLSGGSPVDSTRSSYNTDRRFAALAVNYGPFANGWDFSGYGVVQEFVGEVDRRALGTEIHYFQPGRTVVALVDYDLYYQELNNVLFLGTFDLPARWILNVNADRRRTPNLSVRNALIGQPTSSFDELLAQFTREEINQLARDRTSIAELYSVSMSRPAGERWQWTLDASSIAIGGTDESGGVEAIPEAPREMAYSALAIGNSVFTSGDLEALALRYQTGGAVETTSLGISTRWPIWGGLRITPRLRIDRRVFVIDSSKQMLYAPSLRLDYQLKHILLELEAGSEISDRDVGESFEKAKRNYFSLGYRYNF
jgi:hypothetical protein